MKIGDTIPVTIGGHVVANATIKELADGTATLIFPATQVIMGVRSELTDLPENEKNTTHVILGTDEEVRLTDNVDTSTPPVVETPPAAPVVEPPPEPSGTTNAEE